VLLPFNAIPGETWWSPTSEAIAALLSGKGFTSHIVIYDIPSGQVTNLAPELTDIALWYRPRAALSPDFALLAYLATDTQLGEGTHLSLAQLCPQELQPTPAK
jgi:hypothetical protein